MLFGLEFLLHASNPPHEAGFVQALQEHAIIRDLSVYAQLV